MALRVARYCGEADKVGLDEIDRAILDGVEACLPWPLLLRSVGRHTEEVEGRVMRLLNTGFLEGRPGMVEPLATSAARESWATESRPRGVADPYDWATFAETEPDDVDAEGWAAQLPLPNAEEETSPSRAPTPIDIDAVLFELDPPSTLQSLLRRGPLSVEIQTLPPAERAGGSSQRSDVFRKLSIEQSEIDRLLAGKRSGRR